MRAHGCRPGRTPRAAASHERSATVGATRDLRSRYRHCGRGQWLSWTRGDEPELGRVLGCADAVDAITLLGYRVNPSPPDDAR